MKIPRLERIPFLVHGFGKRHWSEKDFRRRPEWKRLQHLFLNQVHSSLVHSIDRLPEENLSGDAMVTACPSLLLVIRTADCLPVLIADERRKVIAAVHCGWRGTSVRVIQKAIERMMKRYGCSPSSLLAAMGPCIGRDCYEVGEDVFGSFAAQGLLTEFFRRHPRHQDKYLFDLRGANIAEMEVMGMKRENIFQAEVCTHCCGNLASYRRDGDRAGRMLSFIGILA